MRADARALSEDEEHQAIVMALDGRTLRNIQESLGFSDSKRFWEYRQRNPEFAKRLDSARVSSCEYLRDRLTLVNEEYPDPRQARVYLDALTRQLQFTDPAKYGPKLDLNVTQSLDISGSLHRMQQQLDASYRDVTPQLTKANEINDLW